MAIFQEGKAPRQKSIFPDGAKVQRFVFHDMMVIDGQLLINADDDPDFRAKCAKLKKQK